MSINPEQWEVFTSATGIDSVYRYPPGGGVGESYWKIDPATAPRYRYRQCDSLGVFLLVPVFMDTPAYIESATEPAPTRHGIIWHNPSINPPTTKVLTLDSPSVYTPISGARTKVQGADQAVLTTTLTNATDLFIDVEANAVYALSATLLLSVNVAGVGLQCDVTGPGIALAALFANGITANGVTKWETTDTALGVTHSGTVTGPQTGIAVVRISGGLKIGGAAGTFRFRFAQLVLSLVNPVTLLAGSVLSLDERI